MAQRNIKVDEIAKSLMCTLTTCTPLHFYNCWEFGWHGKKLSHINKKEVYNNIMMPNTLLYLQQKLDLDDLTFSYFDWSIHKKAFSSLNFAKQQQISKHCTHFCAVGVSMLKWKFWDHD